ncbi:Tfp pilus assembly protein FimT/FimU [Marinobacter flavimaris]|jgi:MSHA pilin protein MshC|uniref:Type II secretion system protein n=1 Tax=Marinobacter adhaerens TaxID=1033846 RepID=A0A352IS72_9GAMM|nr:type II secretory pathway, pseudopilin PulG [Marinobacter sp.]PTB92638.1 type II secretion system protein [Marinobacter sp. B9-2]HBC34305.1 type II secretion system protein [Marinobacter adhaerens]|tara:strand:- start:230 stop:682 length:453 start_codon:yes stop_codon:yes gene_type:complete
MRVATVEQVQGFTLVELIAVVILIGILAAVGVGLFASRSAFSPLLASQQLASATLLAQQAALAGNEAGSLSVTQGADDFVFTVGPGTPSEREFRMSRNGTGLSVSGASFPISFSDLGRPDTSGDVLFTFSGNSTFTVCLSSLGAVYGGGC